MYEIDWYKTYWAIVGILVCLCIYFIPGAMAHSRKHNNTFPIVLLNILLGWTFLGWVIALCWAATDNVKKLSNEAMTQKQ